MDFIHSRYFIPSCAITGLIIRAFIAHGDWQLFVNPWFPLFIHYQPWL